MSYGDYVGFASADFKDEDEDPEGPMGRLKAMYSSGLGSSNQNVPPLVRGAVLSNSSVYFNGDPRSFMENLKSVVTSMRSPCARDFSTFHPFSASFNMYPNSQEMSITLHVYQALGVRAARGTYALEVERDGDRFLFSSFYNHLVGRVSPLLVKGEFVGNPPSDTDDWVTRDMGLACPPPAKGGINTTPREHAAIVLRNTKEMWSMYQITRDECAADFTRSVCKHEHHWQSVEALVDVGLHQVIMDILEKDLTLTANCIRCCLEGVANMCIDPRVVRLLRGHKCVMRIASMMYPNLREQHLLNIVRVLNIAFTGVGDADGVHPLRGESCQAVYLLCDSVLQARGDGGVEVTSAVTALKETVKTGK